MNEAQARKHLNACTCARPLHHHAVTKARRIEGFAATARDPWSRAMNGAEFIARPGPDDAHPRHSPRCSARTGQRRKIAAHLEFWTVCLRAVARGRVVRRAAAGVGLWGTTTDGCRRVVALEEACACVDGVRAGDQDMHPLLERRTGQPHERALRTPSRTCTSPSSRLSRADGPFLSVALHTRRAWQGPHCGLWPNRR